MPQERPIPNWPRIKAVTHADGTGEVTINGTSHLVAADTHHDAIDTILDRITDTASKIGRPVRVTTSGHDGEWKLTVHPDGHVEEDSPQPATVGRALGQ